MPQFGNWTLIKDYFNTQPSLASQYVLQWTLLSDYFRAQSTSGVTFPTVTEPLDFVPYDALEYVCGGA